jgi:ABC-type multidrug transport system fused ATPase/permease subunit
VNEVLTLSHLNTNLHSVDPLVFEVTDRGTNLSGGQLQRLGIARALYSDPKVILLDEATSALDGQTEAAISETIKMLKGSVTVLMIAHRLSSVRNADKVIYVDKGRVLASGTFTEVRNSVPNFEIQASLMGL